MSLFHSQVSTDNGPVGDKSILGFWWCNIIYVIAGGDRIIMQSENALQSEESAARRS